MRDHPIAHALPVLALGAVLATAWQAWAATDPTAWIDALHVRPGVPLFTLPRAAGTVIAVDERRATDAYVQTVTLRGDPGTVGENRIVVTVTRDALAPRIADETLSAEAEQGLPPMTMALGPADLRNELGGFGAAVGRKGGLTCAYGWQTVDLADRWISGDQPSIFQERHALSLRMRLCRTDLDATALTTLMQDLRGTVGEGVPDPVWFRPTESGDAMSAALDLHQIGPAPVEPEAEPVALRRSLADVDPVRAVTPRVRFRRRPLRTAFAQAVRHRRVGRPSLEGAAPVPTALTGMPQVPLPQ